MGNNILRTIVKINEEKCNGCGLCITACHEGAIQLENGKAKLIRDDYCDGLGNCLPVCPTGAITFEERETLAYNQEAVDLHLAKKASVTQQNTCASGGCPGSAAKKIQTPVQEEQSSGIQEGVKSQLGQWPVQIQLVPVNAPYFDGANLLIAADCTAYAYGNFHKEFIKNHVTLIGCPKLDTTEYSEKLTAILSSNRIKSVRVVRMEVPCCGGIEHATITALKNCQKMIPWQVTTISCNGEILE